MMGPFRSTIRRPSSAPTPRRKTFEAHAQANFLPADRLQISFTPVIVNTGSELVLFDTGNGDARMPAAGHLIHHTLKAAGYSPDQVDKVVITHYHPDHIGGLMMGGKPAFPNATYVAAGNEHDFWSAEERMSGGTERVAKLVASNITPMKDKFTFVKDGDEVAPGIRAMAANGHTPGHTAYHIESAGQRILVVATLPTSRICRLPSPNGMSSSTWTRMLQWRRARRCSTCWQRTAFRSPATTCRSRRWATSTSAPTVRTTTCRSAISLTPDLA
jgi:glyoxylase-like metal-dependent hydrolase (beta-lactamase superfamily II)